MFRVFATLHEKLPPDLPFTVLEFGIPNAHPEIAVLAAQVPEFMDLLKSNPQLAVLYAWSRVSAKTTPDVIRNKVGPPVRSGARGVVESMELPARPVILRLLRRLPLRNLPAPQALQRVLMQKDYPDLLFNLNAPIKTNTLGILAQFSFPLTSQLVREINTPSREFIERRGNLSRLFGDTLQMMATLEMPFDVFSQIRCLNRVARLHDEVVTEWNREESRILGLSGDTALPCPVRCPEWVEPLDSIDVVRAAATEFKNCARIYIMRVWHKEYYLFKVRGDNGEAAMLGIKLLPDDIQFHQLEAPAPRQNLISDELRVRVNEWIENLHEELPSCHDYKRFITEKEQLARQGISQQ